jgi:hypothetical protein
MGIKEIKSLRNIDGSWEEGDKIVLRGEGWYHFLTKYSYKVSQLTGILLIVFLARQVITTSLPLGDEEVEEGEDAGHYESMVFNLLTGNQQGYQVPYFSHTSHTGLILQHFIIENFVLSRTPLRA